MIVLSEEAYKYMKKMCMKRCIGMILIGAGLYTIINKIIEQEYRIDDLTKKVNEEESNLKGE